jgi:hypothetical protein
VIAPDGLGQPQSKRPGRLGPRAEGDDLLAIDVEQAERERPALAAEEQAKAADPPRSPASSQHDGAPIVADTPDGHAASLAYYELLRLDNLPTSQRDHNDAKRGLEPPAERDAREQRDNPPPR